MFIQWNVHSS
ncbi:hypothetical protein YPPY92_2926, partial [Yersinia pestis PY-92]